jgi:predicted ATPase
VAPIFHILTGAPGTGKTSILDVLGRDLVTVNEPAREVLAEQRRGERAGPRPTDEPRDEAHFVALLLERSILKYMTAQQESTVVLFDRGIPDCIAYANHLETDEAASIEASHRHRYEGRIFMLEPWAEIYTTDEERSMSFSLTMAFHEHLVVAYDEAGYRPQLVPRGSVLERARFIKDEVRDGRLE